MAKLYPIIGGPLDGKRANLASFQEPSYEKKPHPQGYSWDISDETKPIPGTSGPYFEHRDEYVAMNRSGNFAWTKAQNAAPTMIFLHVSILGA